MAYSPCTDSRLFSNPIMKKLREDTISFIYHVLEEDRTAIIRDDYLEMLELTLLFFGEIPATPIGAIFRIPGCYSNARFMNKVIYVIKIYLFRKHFFLSDDELEASLEFCLFATLIYVRYWFTCTKASDAAYNDLDFIKNMHEYLTISENVANVALAAISRHLWYIGGELVVLSLFSDKVPVEIKAKMQETLLELGPASLTRQDNSLKCTTMEHLDEKSLEDFIDRRSFFLFSALNIDVSFLDEPIDVWESLASYKNGKEKTKNLPVVNDPAERAVKLAIEFSHTITNDEEDKQRLFTTVSRNRKALPNCNKRTIYESYCKT